MINLNHFNSFKFLLQKFELFEGLVGINEVRFSKNIGCYIILIIYNKILIYLKNYMKNNENYMKLYENRYVIKTILMEII